MERTIRLMTKEEILERYAKDKPKSYQDQFIASIKNFKPLLPIVLRIS